MSTLDDDNDGQFEEIDLSKPTGDDEPGNDEDNDRGDVVTGEEPPAPEAKTEAPTEPTQNVDDETPTDEPKENRVPLSRFKEVLDRTKELEAQLAALQAGQQPTTPPAATPPEFDIKAKRKEYNEALMLGDEENANRIAAEIDDHVLEQATRNAVKLMQAKSEEERIEAENKEMQQAAVDLVKEYPFLNKESEQANPRAITEVVALRNGYIEMGMKPSEALREAVSIVAPRYADGKQPDDEQKPLVEKRQQRQDSARERMAATATAQPSARPGSSTRGITTSTMNPEELTEEQFDQLTPKQKAEMRGDSVAN